MNANDATALRAHVAELEHQLQVAKALLRRAEVEANQSQMLSPQGGQHRPGIARSSSHYGNTVSLPIGPDLHNLILLADSALPVGSFHYSSGLESFLAHHKPIPQGETMLTLLKKFLKLSIQTMAYTNVPYLLAAFRDPMGLMELDNDLDASTPCTVARRASVAQGKAMLTLWEKAFARPAKAAFADEWMEAATAIELFSADLKMSAISSDESHLVNGHMAPLWGAMTLSLGINLEEAGYLFLLNHAKAVVSAAVRLPGVIGPYMAQTILASLELQELIRKSLEQVWFLQPEDAGQVVPIMDLWVGRHEMLYSRIFHT